MSRIPWSSNESKITRMGMVGKKTPNSKMKVANSENLILALRLLTVANLISLTVCENQKREQANAATPNAPICINIYSFDNARSSCFTSSLSVAKALIRKPKTMKLIMMSIEF